VFNKGTSTVNFTSGSNDAIDSTGSSVSDFNVLNFNGSGGQWTVNSDLTTADNLTVISGTLVDTVSITGASGKTFQVNNGATFRMTGSAIYPTIFTTITYQPTSTVEYKQSSASVTATTYGHLSLNGSGTYTLPNSTFIIDGDLFIGSSATVTKGSGTIVFSGGTTQTVTDNHGTA